MKNKTIPLDQGRKPQLQDQNDAIRLYRPAEEMYVVHMYWFSCPYYSPFLVMMDWAIVFDELKKILSKGSAAKKKNLTLNDKADEKL